MKKYQLFLTLMLLTTALQAQYPALKTGEKAPDLSFSNVLNSATGQFSLADLRGKLVILDFWGTNCAPCIEDFPKLDSLQKRFKDSIAIVLVAEGVNKTELTNWFTSHPYVFHPSLPILTGSSKAIVGSRILDKMFPHTGVPYQVWISPAGVFLKGAEATQLTVKNIETVLKTGVVTFRSAKKNVYANLFDARWKDLVDYSVTIMRYRYADGLHAELNPNYQMLTESGTIACLYQRAYCGPGDKEREVYKPVHLLLEVKNPSDYVNNNSLTGDAYTDWAEKHFFTYQLTVPNSFKGDLYQMMKSDLDRYFHLTSAVEKRKVKCYVLIRTDSTDRLKTKGGVPFNNFHEITDLRSTEVAPIRSLKNEPFSACSYMIKTYVENCLKVPFVDATGYPGKVDVTMDGRVLDQADLPLWKSALKKYGLDLVEKECEVDMLVIREAAL